MSEMPSNATMSFSEIPSNAAMSQQDHATTCCSKMHGITPFRATRSNVITPFCATQWHATRWLLPNHEDGRICRRASLGQRRSLYSLPQGRGLSRKELRGRSSFSLRRCLPAVLPCTWPEPYCSPIVLSLFSTLLKWLFLTSQW